MSGNNAVSAIVGVSGGKGGKEDPRVLICGKPMSPYEAKRRGYDPKSAPKISSLRATAPLVFGKTAIRA